MSMIKLEDEGGSAGIDGGVAGNPDGTNQNEQLPVEKMNSTKVREFGEKLCENT